MVHNSCGHDERLCFFSGILDLYFLFTLYFLITLKKFKIIIYSSTWMCNLHSASDSPVLRNFLLKRISEKIQFYNQDIIE